MLVSELKAPHDVDPNTSNALMTYSLEQEDVLLPVLGDAETSRFSAAQVRVARRKKLGVWGKAGF